MSDAKEGKKGSTAAAPAGKKLPLKTALVLVGVLLLEGAAISAAFLLAGGPADVKAQGAEEDLQAIANQPVEELVVQERFQNTRSGRPYLYETEIYIVIRRKDQANVQDMIKTRQAAISTDISAIFRSADPSHLIEPKLTTLTRQIKAALEDRVGRDADGQSIVQEVLIRKCVQFRADS